jgi:hypothetical protein
MYGNNESVADHVELFKFKLQSNQDELLGQPGLAFTILSVYIPPIIIVLGSFGNLVSFLVFFKICKIDLMLSQMSLLRTTRSVLSSVVKNVTPFSRNSPKTNHGFDAPLMMENIEQQQQAIAPVQNSNRNSVVFKLKNTVATSNGSITIYLYLCALAIFDLTVLYTGLLNDWMYDITQGMNVKNYSNLLCKSITYLAFVASHTSSFLVVMTSFIRFMAFYSPFKTAALTNMNNFKPILISLVGVFCLLNIHFLFTMHLVEVRSHEESLIDSLGNETSGYRADLLAQVIRNLTRAAKTYECRIKPSVFAQTVWPIMDKLMYSLLPFILILVFNLLIVINLSKAQKFNYIVYMSKQKTGSNTAGVRNRSGEDGHSATRQTLSPSTPFGDKKKLIYKFNGSSAKDNLKMEKSYSGSDNQNLKKTPLPQPNQLDPELSIQITRRINSLKKKKNFGKRFTFMLVGLSASFLVLTLPVVVFMLLVEPLKQHIDRIEDLSESNEKYEWLGIAQRVAMLLMYLNHSINFVVYYVTSARFRRQAKTMAVSVGPCLVVFSKVGNFFRCDYTSRSFYIFRRDNSRYA